jgi:threonine/homoserine/homoserine lactone efflux protein
MPDTVLLLGFIAASLIVLVLPGPGVFYVLTRSASQGRRAGLISALGLSVGALAHVAAAAAGLSALLLTSATAFGVVKTLGAGYLIYIGIRTLLAKPSSSATIETPAPLVLGRLFWDGVVISVFNPKIAVFFLAFLPQFIDPVSGSITSQIILLGILYCALALLTDGTYAVLAGSARRWLGGRIKQSPVPRYLTGGIYIGLGINTALTGRQT